MAKMYYVRPDFDDRRTEQHYKRVFHPKLSGYFPLPTCLEQDYENALDMAGRYAAVFGIDYVVTNTEDGSFFRVSLSTLKCTVWEVNAKGTKLPIQELEVMSNAEG